MLRLQARRSKGRADAGDRRTRELRVRGSDDARRGVELQRAGVANTQGGARCVVTCGRGMARGAAQSWAQDG